MIYFKTIQLNKPNKAEVEKTIRSLALKRNTWIDFVNTGTNIGTNKHFVGKEGKKDTQFARIRYSVANYLPKIILSFPKNEDEQFYKMRLGFKSFIIFCLLSAIIPIVFILLFTNPNGLGIFITVVLLYLIFIFLILWEIKSTEKSINIAITQSQQT